MNETNANAFLSTAHSENQFADYRDFWWSKGFLDLMARRIGLGKMQSVLDVGCGMCHWSKLLTPYLNKPAYVVGVDKDTKWAAGSAELTHFFEGQGCWFDLVEGDAMDLPFADESFDMVTCQTVLMHVSNPAKAIAEMKRVLKPGGTILCVEPNNRIQSLLRNSVSEHDSIEEMMDHVKYSLILEQGKKRLGYGDNSIGDLLPGLLDKAGFSQIDVRLSDKAMAMLPPYDTVEQLATRSFWNDGSTRDAMNHSDLHYFRAFGEKYLKFYDTYHRKYEESGQKLNEALQKNDFHSAGGALVYLVSGIK